MCNIKIRHASISDKNEYISMAKAFYATDAVMHPIPDQYFEDAFSEVLRSDDFARCYIIEIDGIIAGYGLTARTFSQEAGGITVFIEELYIKEGFRSRGAGKCFFEYLFNEEKTARRYRLEVEETNPRAIELYEKLGFEFLEYKQMYLEVANKKD